MTVKNKGFITINNGTNIKIIDNLFFNAEETAIFVSFENITLAGTFSFEKNTVIDIANSGIEINIFRSSNLILSIKDNYIANCGNGSFVFNLNEEIKTSLLFENNKALHS